jgi:hypothetical protein
MAALESRLPAKLAAQLNTLVKAAHQAQTEATASVPAPADGMPATTFPARELLKAITDHLDGLVRVRTAPLAAGALASAGLTRRVCVVGSRVTVPGCKTRSSPSLTCWSGTETACVPTSGPSCAACCSNTWTSKRWVQRASLGVRTLYTLC